MCCSSPAMRSKCLTLERIAFINRSGTSSQLLGLANTSIWFCCREYQKQIQCQPPGGCASGSTFRIFHRANLRHSQMVRMSPRWMQGWEGEEGFEAKGIIRSKIIIEICVRMQAVESWSLVTVAGQRATILAWKACILDVDTSSTIQHATVIDGHRPVLPALLSAPRSFGQVCTGSITFNWITFAKSINNHLFDAFVISQIKYISSHFHHPLIRGILHPS